MRRGFDWKLPIVLATAGTIFIAAVLILHHWKRSFQPQQEATAAISAAEKTTMSSEDTLPTGR